METFNEMNVDNPFIKSKEILGEASNTNYITRNGQKMTLSKMTNSNSNINSTITPQLLNNDNKNNNLNTSDSLFQLNIKNNNNFNNSNSSEEKKKEEKKSEINPKIKNKKLVKIHLSKKRQKKLQKMQSEYYAKYPKTIFQKIIKNLDKVKIRTNNTLLAMKKNLRISSEEVAKRLNYQKQSELVATNILNFEQREKRNKNIYNLSRSKNFNNSQQSFHIGKYKNISTILPNISSNNINQSISGSTIININNQNELSEYNTINMNRTQYNMSIKKGFKTGIRSKSQLNINNNYHKNDDFGFREFLNLVEIPRVSLVSIKEEYPYKPLYPLDGTKYYYKNMYHNRNLDFPLYLIRAHCYKIYGIPAILVEQNSFHKESEINNLTIINKIQLIQDNIDYFKTNLMYKNEFLESFNNMENLQKAEFNYNLEEICCILIKIIPIILQNYYDILKKLLCLVIPDIKEEKSKKPENEHECLKLNYTFLNSVTEYFNVCLEVYRVLNKKCDRFNYTINEFCPLNSYLDVTRYNTTNLISFANSYIDKTKNDLKILEKLEIGLNLKKAEKKEIDIFERYHERHRKKVSNEDIKIERINRALNLRSRINRPNIKDRKKYEEKERIIKKTSAFNSKVFRDMMKYFKPSIKAKIIAQQVIDRYEEKKKKYGELNDSDED